MITSVRIAPIFSAAAASRVRFTATIPPNGEIGSQRNAKSQASASEDALATPQGLACLMIATVGASNSATHSIAASVSFRLLYDSSIPWTCVAVATPGRDELA